MSRIENPRAQESIADIAMATDRLQRLLIQLLALARADGAGPSGLDLRAIDIPAVARSVAEEHALPAVRAGVEVHFASEDNEPLLSYADQVLVTELIGNLVDNAVRYNQPGGSVTVHVTGAPEQIFVDVEDDGPGIPESEHDKVFTRFYRLHRDQGRPGSGLGLSIVQVLAHSLNAQVSLSPGANGKGLRARVVFRRLTAP